MSTSFLQSVFHLLLLCPSSFLLLPPAINATRILAHPLLQPSFPARLFLHSRTRRSPRSSHALSRRLLAFLLLSRLTQSLYLFINGFLSIGDRDGMCLHSAFVKVCSPCYRCICFYRNYLRRHKYVLCFFVCVFVFSFSHHFILPSDLIACHLMSSTDTKRGPSLLGLSLFRLGVFSKNRFFFSLSHIHRRLIV